MKRTDIERLRRQLGLTQSEFAAALGGSRPHISLIEGRWRGVFPDMAFAIVRRWPKECAQLKITAETMMRGNPVTRRKRKTHAGVATGAP